MTRTIAESALSTALVSVGGREELLSGELHVVEVSFLKAQEFLRTYLESAGVTIIAFEHGDLVDGLELALRVDSTARIGKTSDEWIVDAGTEKYLMPGSSMFRRSVLVAMGTALVGAMRGASTLVPDPITRGVVEAEAALLINLMSNYLQEVIRTPDLPRNVDLTQEYLLQFLSRGDYSHIELARRCFIPPRTILEYLHKMEEAGLVETTSELKPGEKVWARIPK